VSIHPGKLRAHARKHFRDVFTDLPSDELHFGAEFMTSAPFYTVPDSGDGLMTHRYEITEIESL